MLSWVSERVFFSMHSMFHVMVFMDMWDPAETNNPTGDKKQTNVSEGWNQPDSPSSACNPNHNKPSNKKQQEPYMYIIEQ